VLCAGNSSRFALQAKKQWLRTNNIPLWLFVTNRLKEFSDFNKIIIASHKKELNYMKNFSDDFIFVQGGNTRQESMKNALKEVQTDYVMVTDVARTCIPKDVIENLIISKTQADCIVPVLYVNDTVVYKDQTIQREEVKLIQTPQLSNTQVLKNALNTQSSFTDDSSAIKSVGGSIKYIRGSIKSKKLTLQEDIDLIDCLEEPSNNFFTGTGFDIHPFEENKQMYLGGISIDVPYGFKAHSDGDVLIHSLIDALLGAIGAGDIGEFFPDTDLQYENIDSKILLKEIVEFVYNVGYEIVNIDLTIIAQKPKINPYKNEIKEKISKLLNLEKQFVNIKATTAEKLGFITSVTRTIINKSFDFFKDNNYDFSINITERDLLEGYLIAFLKEKITLYGMKPSRVTFEILENITISKNSKTITQQLNELREMGFKIAIDDFGIENSNFSRLLEINIDFIKLDGIFIKNLKNNEKNRTITKAIVNLAKTYGVVNYEIHLMKLRELDSRNFFTKGKG
jgi:2-C-methyl-D-erythritol 4-phosphate cytidylyltransferase/2-C-methyl-D-erythritol 2,4-cyclodiphosphate synthase